MNKHQDLHDGEGGGRSFVGCRRVDEELGVAASPSAHPSVSVVSTRPPSPTLSPTDPLPRDSEDGRGKLTQTEITRKLEGSRGEREREKITPTIWHASVCPHKPLPRIQEHDYPHTYMHTRPGAHTHLSILRKTFSNWVVVMIAVIGGDTAPTCQ